MRELIVKTKNKKEEKVLKAILDSLEINYYSELQEEEAVFKTRSQSKKGRKNKSKEKLISEIKEAVKNMNLVTRGKLKARPAKELLDEL
jgi:hypothetical protein